MTFVSAEQKAVFSRSSFLIDLACLVALPPHASTCAAAFGTTRFSAQTNRCERRRSVISRGAYRRSGGPSLDSFFLARSPHRRRVTPTDRHSVRQLRCASTLKAHLRLDILLALRARNTVPHTRIKHLPVDHKLHTRGHGRRGLGACLPRTHRSSSIGGRRRSAGSLVFHALLVLEKARALNLPIHFKSR